MTVLWRYSEPMVMTPMARREQVAHTDAAGEHLAGQVEVVGDGRRTAVLAGRRVAGEDEPEQQGEPGAGEERWRWPCPTTSGW